MAAVVASLPHAVLYRLLSVKFALSSTNRSRDIPLHPLHCALKRNLTDSVILDLIAEDPIAAACPLRTNPYSEQEVLPLHYAILKHEQTTEAVLLALLDAFPHAARIKIDVPVTNTVTISMWPLHFALQNHLPSKVVVALLVSFPEASRELIWMGNQGGRCSAHEYYCHDGNNEGRNFSGSGGRAGGILPFHLAQFLEYPEADVVGPLFFHVLMGNGSSSSSSEEYLSHEDDVTTSTSPRKMRRGINLLHYILRHSDLHDKIPDILGTNPHAAFQLMKLRSSDLPLDYFCSFGVDLKSISNSQSITKIRPASHNVSPLHFALCRIAAAGQGEKVMPSSILMSLFHAHREAAAKAIHLVIVESEQSRTTEHNIFIFPFHLCEILQLQGKVHEDVADALFQEQIAHTRTKEETIPLLHYVLQYRLAPTRLLGLLKVEHFREAARERMPNGDMPLHYALRSQIYSEEALLALVEAYPEAAMIRSLSCDDENEQGRNGKPLPLHVAAVSNTPPGVVKKLIDLYPNSLNRRDARGNTPADLVQPNLPGPSIRFICQPKMSHLDDGSDALDEDGTHVPKEETKDKPLSDTGAEIKSPPMSPYKTGGGFNFLALGQKMGLIGADPTPTASTTIKPVPKLNEESIALTPTLSHDTITEATEATNKADERDDSGRDGSKMSSPKAVSSFDDKHISLKPLSLTRDHIDGQSNTNDLSSENRTMSGSEWTAV